MTKTNRQQMPRNKAPKLEHGTTSYDMDALLKRHDFDTELAHKLRESCWDAALFIWAEYLSMGASPQVL